jgi:acyl dehydratase
MEKEYFEDYHVGERFISPARTVTEADIHAYASFTGDWHPMHTDIEAAKKGPFGERIAHGMLVLSLGIALPFRLGQYVTAPKKFIAFYGMEKVRFTAPCKIGDTIHTEVEIIEMKEKDSERGILVSESKVLNQKSETVIVFTAQTLVGRRPRP